MIKKRLNINGVSRTVFCEADEMLADVLRKRLMLTGCKVGCRQGQCGACSIILDGKVVRSCITKMSRVADDAVIETIEGLGTADDLHPLQVAWMGSWLCTVRFLQPRLYYVRQRSAGRKSGSNQRRSARLVQQTSQPVPLHRL